MLIMIAAVVFALALTLIFTVRRDQTADTQLSEPRPALPSIGVQIICGNCSGDEDRPVKTYLDRFGHCGQCGGHSYMLASSRGVYAQQLIATRRAEDEIESGSSRVIPFEVPLSRAARTEKVAV